MNILQITYESFGSPFGFGGAGVRAYEIYRRLRDRHRITFLCMRYPGARDCEIQGIAHRFVGSETKNLTWSVLAYTIQAARFVRRYGSDYDIIVENFLPSTPFSSRFLTNTPVILQVQGIMEGHALSKFHFYHSLPMYLCEKFYPGLYDRFIFVSPVTMEKVMAGVKRKVNQCQVISNGVDEELLRATPKSGDYILFFSRIDRYTKGLDILFSAFSRLAPEFQDIRLVLAGYEFSPFCDLIKGLSDSLKRRITYAGFLSGKEKLDILAGARIVVLPSRHESAPISILEAAACGKAVVVSDIRELKFVTEHGFGLEFPSGSAAGLKERLELLLRNDELTDNLGARGREYAKHFRWDSIAMEFENALRVAGRVKK
jgi:glycosyltransferase involved in cell wall biosynthesis